MLSAAFTQTMLNKLSLELHDPATAAIEIPYLAQLFFNAPAPATIATGSINSIVAFSFGDQPNPAGGSALPLPGPVNTAIADSVHRLHVHTKAPIYAQWEVASVLQTSYGLTTPAVTSVSPPTVSGGQISYPSLAQVVGAVTALVSAPTLGNVAVVTHFDQETAAIQACAAAGVAAFAPEFALPMIYDPQASQPANRQRFLYLMQSIAIGFENLRANLIATEYPNG